MKNKLKIIFIILSFFSILRSQNLFPILGGQRVGTSIFTFLNIGISARAVGMGESVVALNQDASSIYYNPAIIAQLKNTEISISTVQWPAEIKYDYFSMTHQLFKRHYFGFNGGLLHMSPMMETTEFFPDGTGNYFTFQDWFFGIVYGAKMTDRFSYGLTIKHVNEELAGHKMNGLLLDMGTFYWTGYGSLRFCASLTNFGMQSSPEGKYEKKILDQDTGKEIIEVTEYEKFSPPTKFRVGAGLDPINNEMQILTVSLQLNHPVDNAEYIVTGIEYSYLNILYLRAGHKFNKYEENFTYGIGLVVPVGPIKARFDYGYANFDNLNDPKRFSVGFSIE